MKYVEVIADAGNADTVSAIAESHESADFRVSVIGEDGLQAMRLLVPDDKLQQVLDSLQKVLGAQEAARIVVLPVEIALPQDSELGRKEEDAAVTVRESLLAVLKKMPGWTRISSYWYSFQPSWLRLD
ncbi:MAG: hypothetical protein ACOH1Q_06715 [Thiobacillus sp.]